MADIFINQLGYMPDSRKKAVFTFPVESFEIVDEKGRVCFSGNVQHFGFDKNSGDDVYTADFSEFESKGKYFIRTDSGKRSELFTIGMNVYDKVFDDTSKAFYFLRCGCGLDRKHAGEFHHGKCHYKNAVLWDDNSVSLDVSGGWHDAGDYGRYVTAGACALAHLLYAYKLFPKAFDEQNLNIPESDEAMPDILAECRYELEWLLKMQREDGAVYHKATTAGHAAFVMPEDDTPQMYVLPVSSMATADFAAVCALAYGIYKKYDTDFADRLLAAAEKTGNWIENNPGFIGFRNPDGCTTGGYGEHTDDDNRFWAYAELFASTGKAHYHELMKKALEKEFPIAELGYASVGGLGALAYCLCENDECDSALAEKFKAAFAEYAEKLKNIADSCGYGAAMTEHHYGWGSNMNLMKHGMIFAIADKICGRKEFTEYAFAQADVLLGLNALGISYVTGNGYYRYNYPHLRPSAADGIEECIPGMVSGGPNRYPVEETARVYIPEGTPPMKCYVDREEFYSINEITIYWNSPAVFVLAYIKNIGLNS